MSPAPAARILVVEDDRTLRAILVRWLEERGHRVTPCASAAEARQCLSPGAFRIAIVDLTLPDADGAALIEELIRADAALRVIATSGLPRVAPGAAGFLAKPFTASGLAAAVERAAAG